MRKFLQLLLLLVVSLPATAVEVPEYLAIRAARPDGRRVNVQGLKLSRDAYALHFKSGAFHLLAPVGGRTFGAVFLGDGSWELRPATEGERRHLNLVTGDKDLEVMTDSFTSMVLLFSDATAGELEAHSAVATEAPDARAIKAYEDHLEQQKKKYQVNLHLRVLRDLLNGVDPRNGAFLAIVDGKNYAPMLLSVDPLGIGNLAAGFGWFGGEEVSLLSFDDQNAGFWYLSTYKDAAKSGRGKPLTMMADALHYTVDTTIGSKLEIEGTTTIRLIPMIEGMRVLPVHIQPKLRLQEVELISGGTSVPVAVIQEEIELGRLARLFREEVADADAAVVLSAPLKVGETVELKLHYVGREVLQSTGEGYSVRARESWYPNLGTFADLATYHLTFRYPKRNSLISVGELVSEDSSGREKVSTWKADRPMRIAGFNYGEFRKRSRTDEQSKMRVDVYTTRDRERMAGDTIADAVNTARVAHVFFGEAPYPAVSVTQQTEWSFGQSWPSLVFLPTLALTTSTERVMMLEDAGPAMFQVNEFAKMVGWHEFAHQWWGHLVGWESYRDQWLSEGFSEFTAALVLQVTEGGGRYADYWNRQRNDILSRRGGTASGNDAGAISQGFRLATRRSPGAAQSNVYSKGGYVLHMLRMLMQNTQTTNPDEPFIAMMHDFVATYGGKNPSTADFQRVVEKHMSPMMNAGNDGTMNWFFNQWVHGTHVPKLKSTLSVQDAGGGKFRLSGTITQEGVPTDFASVVPIYADFGKGAMVRLGLMRVVGNNSEKVDVTLPLPRKPNKIVINAMSDILVRD